MHFLKKESKLMPEKSMMYKTAKCLTEDGLVNSAEP